MWQLFVALQRGAVLQSVMRQWHRLVVLQCVAVSRSVLQCIAMRCSVLQCVAVVLCKFSASDAICTCTCIDEFCNTLQHTSSRQIDAAEIAHIATHMHAHEQTHEDTSMLMHLFCAVYLAFLCRVIV